MEDLLDLDWKQPSQPSQSSTNTAAQSRYAHPSSSSPNYYASPPSAPATRSSNSAVKPTANSDAFASLFAPSSSKQQADLSLAEAQKRAQQRAQDEKCRNDALWSGIDSASWNSSSPSPALTPASVSRTASPAIVPSKPAPPATKAVPSSDPWDLDAFATSLPQTKSTSSNGVNKSPQKPMASSSDPFDFAAFEDVAPTTADTFDDEGILGALAKPIAEQQRSAHLLDPRLAKLSASTATSSAASSRVPSPASGSRAALSRQARPASRTGSPPPHIVGQIVEMGFSPAQARKALAQTPSGADVDAALELLVGSTAAGDRGTDNDERLARQLHQQEQSRRPADASFHDSDDEDDVAHRRRQREHSGKARDPRSVAAATGSANAAGRSPAPGGAAAAEWQQQADQLYAQASEIGVSVLSKATAFWSSAKAQAQKALDERNRASGDERSTTPSDAGSERHRNRRWGGPTTATASARKTEWEGKPKWMVDAEAAEALANEPAAPVKGASAAEENAFKDSDDDETVPEPATRTARPTKSARDAPAPSVNLWDDDSTPAAPAPRHPAPKAPQTVSDKLKATSNTSSAAKPAYVSPNRRAAAAPRTKPAAAATSVADTRRQDPPVSRSAIQAANKWKDEGNEHFRRGAYDQAETRYSKGIEALMPDFAASYCATGDGVAVETASVWLLPLLSNRANTRSKNGDAAGAIGDCNASLRIVLAPFHLGRPGGADIYRPLQEHADALPVELRESVNLRETYAKALLRRAQAYEATEKWANASADWTLLERFEKEEGSGARTGTNHLKFAREGLVRCERMLGGGPKRETPATKRVPAKRPTAVTVSATSAPLTAAYKATLEKQQAEDTQRFELKDSVDSAIETWKAGKESNLRALLSSLHTILPPDLGWQQVGLHQILDPKGLKKSYTRAITKLHPDKLRSATTHHQMLASAAFHTLNEAWNATPSV